MGENSNNNSTSKQEEVIEDDEDDDEDDDDDEEENEEEEDEVPEIDNNSVDDMNDEPVSLNQQFSTNPNIDFDDKSSSDSENKAQVVDPEDFGNMEDIEDDMYDENIIPNITGRTSRNSNKSRNKTSPCIGPEAT